MILVCKIITFHFRLVGQESLDFFKFSLRDPAYRKRFQGKIDRGAYFTNHLSKSEVLEMVNASDGTLGFWSNAESLSIHPAFACDLYPAWKTNSPLRVSLAIDKKSPYKR